MDVLPPDIEAAVLAATGARSIVAASEIQSLWSGYGVIVRIGLAGCPQHASVVAKVVRASAAGAAHPRGWDTDRSHLRKLRSYRVEDTFYREFAERCCGACRVPALVASRALDGGADLLVLEDLDAAGFPARPGPDADPLMLAEACLAWLAHFHAAFMGVRPDGLWETGTYWHLDTRPDELAALGDDRLRAAAGEIDARLRAARFQTLVHGDAKLANFCFSRDWASVAAVDFQYVGGGCGMKDVAYFIGSCLDEEACARHEDRLLDHYFGALSGALRDRGCGADPSAVEAEWRELFPLAWTDFHRFLKGWSPGHWKLNSYSERIARAVVEQLAKADAPGGSGGRG